MKKKGLVVSAVSRLFFGESVFPNEILTRFSAPVCPSRCAFKCANLV